MNERLKAVSSFDQLGLRNEIKLICFCQHVVHCMNSDISENNDPYFVGLERTFIFPVVSVNEINGMQMLLFVNVIL